MWLVRRNNNVMDFPRTFDRFLNDFNNWNSNNLYNIEEDSVAWSPRVDVKETKNDYIVTADLPGLKKEDIKISVNDNVLTIKGERKVEKTEDEKDYYYHERLYGNFSRSFTLPNEVKAEEIQANYKDGVLDIKLPKTEKVKPREIEIK